MKDKYYYNIFNSLTGMMIASGYGSNADIVERMNRLTELCRFRNRIVKLSVKKYSSEADRVMDVFDAVPTDEDKPLNSDLLSSRVYNALRRNLVNTNFELASLTELELRRINGIGEGAIKETKQYLNRFGLSLREAS